MIGRVLWFDVKKGFGFIRVDDQDVFVHYSKIIAEPGEFRTLEQGETVEFELFFADRENDNKKPQAKNVKIIKGANEYEVLRKVVDSNIRGLATSS